MKETMPVQHEDYEKRSENVERKNFQEALQSVCERYPNLAEKITTSLETPQLGKFHNEGPKMNAHLALILDTLYDVASGTYDTGLLPDIQKKFHNLAVGHNGLLRQELIDYVFLHDLAKPDCLTLKFDGHKQGREVTWQEWQELSSDGGKIFDGQRLASISYFHQSEGAKGQHGNKAAVFLKEEGIPPIVINAIKKHEVAYQFSKINPKTYHKHFVESHFSEEQQDFILLASYIDSMATLDKNGRPFLENFYHLINSRYNLSIIVRYIEQNSDKLSERDITTLMKYDQPLHTLEDVGKIFQTVEYDMQKVKELLTTEVDKGHLDVADIEAVMKLLATNPNHLGPTMKNKMRYIAQCLKQAQA